MASKGDRRQVIREYVKKKFGMNWDPQMLAGSALLSRNLMA